MVTSAKMNISHFLRQNPELSDEFHSLSAEEKRDFTILLYNISNNANLSDGSRKFNTDEWMAVMEQGQDSSWFPPHIEVPLIVTFSVIIVMSLALNAVVCYVVLRYKRLHTNRHAFIVNLSVSDILMASICVPFILLKVLFKNWTYGVVLCKFVSWIHAVNVFASTLSITAIALDRYHVVLYPAKLAKTSKKAKTVGCLTLIWGLSFVAGAPLLFVSRVEDHNLLPTVSFRMCMEHWPSVWSRSVYAGCILLLQFIIPICLLATVHWRICSFFRYRIVRTPSTPFQVNRKQDGERRHRKNTALLLTITLWFAVCWLPLTLINLLADVDQRIFINQNFRLSYAIVDVFAMTSACFNPVMYGWFNPNFRRYISNVLLCRGNSQEDECCQPHARQNTTTTNTNTVVMAAVAPARPVCVSRTAYHSVNVATPARSPKAHAHGAE